MRKGLLSDMQVWRCRPWQGLREGRRAVWVRAEEGRFGLVMVDHLHCAGEVIQRDTD